MFPSMTQMSKRMIPKIFRPRKRKRTTMRQMTTVATATRNLSILTALFLLMMPP